MKQSNTFKRLGAGMVLTAFLLCCFLGTSFSLRPAYAEMQQAPAASLNGGAPVLDMKADNIYFEPGMKIERTFYIQNLSDTVQGSTPEEYYYGFYFRECTNPEQDIPLAGDLAEVVQVSILERSSTGAERVLASGTLASMKKTATMPVLKANSNQYEKLSAGEPKWLVFQIYYPENVGNKGMNHSIQDFEFCLAFSPTISTTN